MDLPYTSWKQEYLYNPLATPTTLAKTWPVGRQAIYNEISRKRLREERARIQAPGEQAYQDELTDAKRQAGKVLFAAMVEEATALTLAERRPTTPLQTVQWLTAVEKLQAQFALSAGTPQEAAPQFDPA